MQVQYNDNIKENGLYATKVYSRGDIIRILEGNIESRPTKYSIHVGDNQHVTDDYGSYINHSFDPTAYIQGKSVVAKRDIEVNEEITFNYNESELEMALPFEVYGILVCGKRERQI